MDTTKKIHQDEWDEVNGRSEAAHFFSRLAEKKINLQQVFPNWQDGELSVGALLIAGTVATVAGIGLGLLTRGLIPPDPAN